MALTPHHTHNEPDPHGKKEEAHAPYEHMRELRIKAQAVLKDLIKIAASLGDTCQTHHAACAAYDAVGSIIIGDPE